MEVFEVGSVCWGWVFKQSRFAEDEVRWSGKKEAGEDGKRGFEVNRGLGGTIRAQVERTLLK